MIRALMGKSAICENRWVMKADMKILTWGMDKMGKGVWEVQLPVME